MVLENIHTPHRGSLEIPGGWGGPTFPRGMGVRRVIYFQGVQEHCPRETYQDSICDLINQQINELQYNSVYSYGNLHISERTFRNNNTFLRSMNMYFSLLYAACALVEVLWNENNLWQPRWY